MNRPDGPNDEALFWKRVDTSIDAGEDPLDDPFVRGCLDSMPHLLEPFAEDSARWRTLRSRRGTRARRPSHPLRVRTIVAVSALIAATVLVYSSLFGGEPRDTTSSDTTSHDAGVLALPTFSDNAILRSLSFTKVYVTQERGGSRAEVVVDGNYVRSRLEVTNHSLSPTAVRRTVHGAIAILTTTLFEPENH